ncbi:hypothetical protein B9Q03_10645 [Candidatus Marsarchaeota G2 archaeon OSP_D]|uniref:Uncharacterized protein n=1 Tax=Candidatus Marsarchaeota G2 archaeon OSP_D TaxID=1978157 RepID=A0A2R6ALX2_9ARCH|nr:MAG: hypothetical protein B9Q03_10645 [Candidatus Marsarchaeota G2 archaeon OSP_D]
MKADLEEIIVYFDGACEPVNPGGVGSWGFVVFFRDKIIHFGYGVLGEGEGVSKSRSILLSARRLNAFERVF